MKKTSRTTSAEIYIWNQAIDAAAEQMPGVALVMRANYGRGVENIAAFVLKDAIEAILKLKRPTVEK